MTNGVCMLATAMRPKTRPAKTDRSAGRACVHERRTTL
jgi:hypothetical protein